MSFDSLQIRYTPPPTVPSALRISTSASPETAPGLASRVVNPANTAAGLVMTKLGNLSATSAYLQQAILGKTSGSGVSFAAAENPELAAALNRIYPGENKPSGITVQMYANMLDAEIGLMQLQSAIGNDAAVEVSSQQVADLITATKAFESAMIGSLGYQNNLAIMLRSLKGDQAIMANLQEQLADYPAVQGTASILDDGLDISPEMGSVFDTYIQNQSDVYAQMFTSMSTPSDVESDLAGVTGFLLSGGVGELAMMLASLSTLREMQHGIQLQSLADDIANSVFVSLLSDVGEAANQMDRMAGLTILPLQISTSVAAGMIRNVQSLADQVGFATSGGLRGMVQGNPCLRNSKTAAVPTTSGAIHPGKISQAVDKALGKVSSGLNSVLTHINMAQNLIDRKNQQLQESLRRAMARRTSDQSAQLDLLCSLRNLEATINLISGLIAISGRGPTANSAVSNLQAINQVLSSFSSPSGSSFSIVNSSVVVTPPTLPTITPNVLTVLNRGGAGLVSTSSLA